MNRLTMPPKGRRSVSLATPESRGPEALIRKLMWSDKKTIETQHVRPAHQNEIEPLVLMISPLDA